MQGEYFILQIVMYVNMLKYVEYGADAEASERGIEMEENYFVKTKYIIIWKLPNDFNTQPSNNRY